MFFKIGRQEAHRRLAASGYRRLADYDVGVECWRHPAGHEIGLTPEDNGDYEEEMIRRAEAQA